MKGEHRHRAPRLAGRHRLDARHRRHGGEHVRRFARQAIRHQRAVRQPGRIDAIPIDAQLPVKLAHQIA
ncbi:MAG TPA: hypothetical protein VF993_01450, partial [Myxococcales bacterium]